MPIMVTVEEAKLIKAKALNNSGLFDVHRWSKYEEINHVVNAIFNEIKELRQSKKIRIREPAKVKRHLKVVIIDLWVANKLALNPYRAISKNKNNYKQKESRYRKIFLKYDYLIPVINDLKKLDYLEESVGYRDRLTGKGKMTRIKATDKLIDKILSPEYRVDVIVAAKGQISIVSDDGEEESIFLRDQDGEDVEYTDTDETNLMRENLRIINSKLIGTRITLEITNEQFEELEAQVSSESNRKIRIIDFTKNKLHRVFNNSFELGGRFYGAWWQNIPRDYRKYIEINYKPTVEIDYSGHHIRILYAGEDIKPPDDPYDLEEFERDDQKKALLIILNALNKTSAIKAIQKEGISEAGGLIDSLELRHGPINKYFYTGEGLRLQYADSLVAEQVMQTMLEHGATVLPVHDSFIVRNSYEQELEEVMTQTFESIFGKSAKTKPKVTVLEEIAKKAGETEEIQFVTDDLEQLFNELNYSKVRGIWGG